MKACTNAHYYTAMYICIRDGTGSVEKSAMTKDIW